MSHEQIKSKSFLARKDTPKFGECHAISFWPGLGLPRPKAIVVIPKINFCQNRLRKKTSKTAKYPWPLRYKKDPLNNAFGFGQYN